MLRILLDAINRGAWVKRLINMAFVERKVSATSIVQIVEDAAIVAASSFGLVLWGLDIMSGGGRSLVRLFIDTPWEGKIIPFVLPETRSAKSKKKSVHPTQKDSSLHEEELIADMGVSIDQCAEISRMVGIALDVEDAFTDAWVLEVSSPGLEREFFHLEQMVPYIGHPINVILEDSHPQYEHRRKFKGMIISVGTDVFEMELDSPTATPCTMTWNEVKRVTLIHIFPDITLSKAALHS